MKKKSIIAILFIVLLTSGCSSNNDTSSDNNSTQSTTSSDLKHSKDLKYSNLNDETTQKKIYDLLTENNIGKNNIDMLMQSVKNYYKSIGDVKLFKESERLSDLQLPYNIYELSDKWRENNPNYSDQNCRLTAFRLFNDFIVSESDLDYNKVDTLDLESDLDALKNNPDAKFSTSDMNKFINLFATMHVKDSKNIEQTAKEISAELEKRKISFKSGNISIINGYVTGVEDNEVFVGHTGVAINTNDGIVFIEKYGFELPYQVTLFKNKEELKLYMFDRLKVNPIGETKSEDPIIMENDKLM